MEVTSSRIQGRNQGVPAGAREPDGFFRCSVNFWKKRYFFLNAPGPSKCESISRFQKICPPNHIWFWFHPWPYFSFKVFFTWLELGYFIQSVYHPCDIWKLTFYFLSITSIINKWKHDNKWLEWPKKYHQITSRQLIYVLLHSQAYFNKRKEIDLVENKDVKYVNPFLIT